MRMKDPKTKEVFIYPLPNLLMMNQRRTYNYTYNHLRYETFTTLSVVMYFQKDSLLTPMVNEVLQSLQSAGIIEHWHNSYFKEVDLDVETIKAQLTIGHLRGAFQVWFGGCIASFVILIVEKLFKKLGNRNLKTLTRIKR
jgi:hypothetical protein